SQAEVEAAAERLEREFIQQATQMGFNRQEVEKYTQSFRDMRTVIQQLPRNVTITANVNPAIQALREFEAQARKTIGNVRNLGGNIRLPNITNPTNAKERRRAALEAALRNLILEMGLSAGPMPGHAIRVAQIRERLATGNYWTGGYTGDGGKFQPAGIVHK